MAANTGACTVVAQTCYNSGWYDYGTKAMYAGKTESTYYPYILKFTTPEFVGASEGITITYKASKGYGSNVTLRYALCTSDANKNNYRKTYSNVTDANQITTGTTTLSSLTSSNKTFTLTIDTTALKPSTTYYLFMWGYNESSMWVTVAATSNISISIGYNNGVVYIGNGTSFDAYQCYIDNGTSFELYVPYIDNGISFEAMGGG